MGGTALAAALGLLAYGAESATQAHTCAPGGDIAATKRYAIPPSPLDAALNRVADENGARLVYRSNLTARRNAPALSGAYTLPGALDALLSGTGVNYRLANDERSVSIILAEANTGTRSDARGAQSLPTIEVGAAHAASTDGRGGAPASQGGQRPGQSSNTPAEAGEAPTAYRIENSSVATKTRTPIMETPVSVQVVSRQVIRDQQATSLSRVLDNVSGVRTNDTTYDARGGDTLQIRGFKTSNIYVDGLRSLNADFGSGSLDIVGVERVEVLKGPASILYGRADPGGIVNIVTAKPQKTPAYGVEQMFGSWGLYRTVLEATGPLTNDGSVAYRMTGLVENQHSFRDFNSMRNYVLNPVVRWDIDAQTQVTANFQYKRQSSPFDSGIAAFTKYDLMMGNPLALIYGAGPMAFLPRSRNLGEPNSSIGTERVMFGFNWSHKFNEDWTLTHRFQANVTQTLERWVAPYYLDFSDPSQPQIYRFGVYQNRHSRIYTTNADLTGRFDTFGVEHNVLIGGDFLSQMSATPTTYLNFAIPNLNLFNPIYTYTPTDKTLFDPTNYGPLANRQHWYGFYLQDQIKLPYNIFVLAGGRYDHANTYSIGFDGHGDTTTDNSQRVTPRVGLLWRPLPEVSLYGSYLTNFGPGAIGGPGQVVPPQSAKQWEIGIKTELFDKKLSATVAYYNLTKTNVPQPDPDPARAAQGYLVPVGETRNKGVEFDLAGEIARGWRVIGSYSYIDSLITKDSAYDVVDPLGNTISKAGYQGFNPPNVSRHMGSLWSTYEIQDGDLRGLKFGGGVNARSKSYADLLNSFHLPGYATVGLMTAYDWTLGPSKFTAQLNVDNLLDTRFYPDGANNLGVYVGAPRAFKGTLRMTF